MAVPLRGQAAACGSRTTRSSSETASPTRPKPRAAYLHGIIGDVVEPERIDTYLDRGPEMLSFVLKNSPLKMCWVPGYSDYYPETPGGRPAGRSIEPKPFNANKLGPDLAGPGAAVRQGAAQHRCDAAGLRAAQPAQASSARCAAQPEGRRAHGVGQGDRQEPRRHGARADRAAADRAAERRVCRFG